MKPYTDMFWQKCDLLKKICDDFGCRFVIPADAHLHFEIQDLANPEKKLYLKTHYIAYAPFNMIVKGIVCYQQQDQWLISKYDYNGNVIGNEYLLIK